MTSMKIAGRFNFVYAEKANNFYSIDITSTGRRCQPSVDLIRLFGRISVQFFST